MSSLFCCGSIKPYRPQYLSHESKFTSFINWGTFPKETSPTTEDINITELNPSFAVQLVRQVNFGPLESKRYFISVEGKDEAFVEVTEDALIQANFKKLNTFKNFKCAVHNRFFGVNIYEKDPVNTHHWRADLARPGSSIDL